MLSGNNEMNLNEATMIKIVQFYFDNKLFNKDERGPVVTSVRYLNNEGFTVKVSEPKPIEGV